MTDIKPVRKAVFPVGGLGTRFLPATKALPKEMLPVVDKPLVQYAVEEAQAAGIDDLIFVTGRGKMAIEDHFDHSFELESMLELRRKHALLAELRSMLPQEGNVSYTRQLVPMGLGHAVWCAREIVGNEPFAVLLADDLVLSERPCLAQMIDTYNKVGGNLISVMDVAREETDKYGIIIPEKEEGPLVKAAGIVEKPSPAEAPSQLAVAGRYILQPEVFEFLGEKRKGAGGEIQLTDALAGLIGRQPVYGFRFEGQRYDCGDKLGYLAANVAYALRRTDLGADFRERLTEILAESAEEAAQ